MDFTLKTYKRLIQSFLQNGYECLTFEMYCRDKERLDSANEKFLILRHDVDEVAENALKMAQIEHNLGVKATYFFRIVQQSNKPEIIKKIVDLGHEIGYHYEDLAFSKGDLNVAKETFERNLTYFRTYYPVQTVCMHGSSTSKYDNREFWKKFGLSEFGLIGEPYLTTDFEKIFYITDTGYAWDGNKYAVRDTVENKFGLAFHTSDEIIQSVNSGKFPKKALMLAHTLWTDNLALWVGLHLREFFRNNLKYIAQRNRFINKLYAKMVQLYWGR